EPVAVRIGFACPPLAAGESTQRQLRVVEGAPAATFGWQRDGSVLRVSFGEQALLEHDTAFDLERVEATNKPILHLLHPLSGVRLTKGAGGEYSHHRGVFLGWNKTTVSGRTVDLWHCGNAAQRHAGYLDPLAAHGPVFARLAALTQWIDADHAILGRDVRQVVVWAPDRAQRVRIDFDIRIDSDTPMTLRGDPQHAGFQVRMANEVAERKDALYVRPETASGGDNDVWQDLGWAMIRYRLRGQDYDVVHVSHAENSGPSVYSTRDYGRFGSFPAADVTPEQPLRLRYRLVLRPLGEAEEVAVGEGEAERTAWLDGPTVRLR
ncbi:MAG: PmoA family protein, partial [Planctomycetes bacterium]|nr:PmoA family protein [Planctomycetota bacterium]